MRRIPTSIVYLRAILALCFLALLPSCSMLITNTVVEPAVGNLQQQTDLDLVCEGAPAYLLMIDSMIAGDPGSEDLLRIGAQAYSGYSTAIAECGLPEQRQQAIAEKGRIYGTSLVSRMLSIAPDVDQQQFARELDQLSTSQVPDLFWGTFAWLNWIQLQKGAPAALADMTMVEQIMARLLELDETFQGGSPHLFFGAYLAAKPPMFGGDPEKSQYHFEKALEISNRDFLIIQTTYAETLARQQFDRKLHDSLLQEVIDYQLERAPEYALTNQIAKRIAERLLADDYFAE